MKFKLFSSILVVASAVSAGTLPTNLPQGMSLWLAPDAGIVAGSTSHSVSEWTDSSGSGNNATQSNPTNQPTVVGGNNGQNALHFDGQNSFMNVNQPISGLAGMTVFMVSAAGVDHTPSSGCNAALSWTETASWGVTYFGTFQTNSQFRFGTTQTGNDNVWKIPFDWTDTFALGEWEHNGTTDSMWFNSQPVGTYTGKFSALGGLTSDMSLGTGGANTRFKGDISEVIIYPRALTTTERQSVEQYLMTKYHL